MSTSVAAPSPTTHKSLLIQSENKGLWYSWTGIEWIGPQERVLLRFCQKFWRLYGTSLRKLYSQLCLRWISSQQNPSPRSQICTSALLSLFLPLLLIVLFCSSRRTSSLKNRTCVSRLASTPSWFRRTSDQTRSEGLRLGFSFPCLCLCVYLLQNGADFISAAQHICTLSTSGNNDNKNNVTLFFLCMFSSHLASRTVDFTSPRRFTLCSLTSACMLHLPTKWRFGGETNVNPRKHVAVCAFLLDAWRFSEKTTSKKLTNVYNRGFTPHSFTIWGFVLPWRNP